MESKGERGENGEIFFPDEEKLIQKQIEICLALSSIKRVQEKEVTQRASHSKSHGCLQGEFIVEADLPSEFQYGIFKEPKNYPIWVRFSNSSPIPQSDLKPDFQGMAIKLMGVPGPKLLDESMGGETQDFILFNHPTFIARNNEDFTLFMESFLKHKTGRFFFPSWNPLKWRLKELNCWIQMARKKVVSPLAIDYWSAVPYLLGPRVVKYKVTSHPENHPSFSLSKSEDYLRQVMSQQLKNQAVSFDFSIQFQTDSRLTPIEDALIEWSPALFPFYKVATITFPPQVFDSPERNQLDENLVFNPWRVLAEHKPVGSLNRARKKVYDQLSRFRQEKNQLKI
jgi:hypothetical protein